MLALVLLSSPTLAQETLVETPEGCRIVVDRTDVFFEGCNVHIRNDLGTTASVNSLGNLVMGYNESPSEGTGRQGSHNIVVGEDHAYNGYASVVSGRGNEVGNRAAVLAAEESTAWAYGAVVAGKENFATYSAVVGGLENVADREQSVVVGGLQNLANGTQATVCGGAGGQADGAYAMLAGGSINRAAGDFSVVVGGAYNWANGVLSTIFGGWDNWVSGDGTIVAGGSCSTINDVLLGSSCTSMP